MWRSRCNICDKAIRGRSHLLPYSRLCCKTKFRPRDDIYHVIYQTSRHSSQLVTLKGPKGKSQISTSLDLKDLPQGLLPCKPLNAANQDGELMYPTVILQARNNMRKFENCVLLTRVGGFYELYFEHAEDLGPLLNLKVAQKRTNAGPVSMVYQPHRILTRSNLCRLGFHFFNLIGS